MADTEQRDKGVLSILENPIRRVAIHQPNLFPRLKVLQKIVKADVWVVLNDVQFVTREWQSRARMRYLNQPSQEFWLIVPLDKTRGEHAAINSIDISNIKDVKRRIIKSVWHCYHRSKYWDWIEDYIHNSFRINTDKLADLCVNSTLLCLSKLELSLPVLFSSKIQTGGRKTTRLVEICKLLGAQTYVSGSGSRSYLIEEEFRAINVDIEWQFWIPPLNIPKALQALDWRNITFLDLIARCGPDILREHILSWKNQSNTVRF